jgi:hypothetical protein
MSRTALASLEMHSTPLGGTAGTNADRRETLQQRCDGQGAFVAPHEVRRPVAVPLDDYESLTLTAGPRQRPFLGQHGQPADRARSGPCPG